MATTRSLHAAVAPFGPGPKLTAEQIEALRGVGSERTLAPGEVLFAEGEPYEFALVLDGIVDMIDEFGTPEQVTLSQRRPGHFIGEFGVLRHQLAPLTGVARGATRVVTISRESLLTVIDTDAELSEIILRTFFERRGRLIRAGAGPTVVGSRFSEDTERILEFLARNRAPFTWLDLERDTAAEEVLQRFQVSATDTPIVICGEKVLRNPANEALARVVGFEPIVHTAEAFDLIVVGAGPAGLGAAVYGASEGLTTLALERVAVGGQAGTSSRIENYLGFPAGLSGAELAVRAALQAEKFHTQFSVPCAAVELRPSDGIHTLGLSNGTEVMGRSVIIATGAHYRKLPLPRLNEFEGMSVHYAATALEATMCAAASVALVGGGNSAGQAALFLATSCVQVFLIIRRPGLADTMSRYLIDEIERCDNIEVITESDVRELVGEQQLAGVEVAHRSGIRRRLSVSALFVFIGADPQTKWLPSPLALDEHGFILTGRDVPGTDDDGHAPAALETSIPGIFAVGDVRSGSIKRVASAVGEGAMAVHLVHSYLRGTQPQRRLAS